MDSLIAAAARALSAGDALGALKHVALRDEPPALALRGIAMAQLGDYALARELLRRAARGFGPREIVARARCVVAEAEVALALRDLTGSPRALMEAASALHARGDHGNACHARVISVRRQLLLGRLEEAGAGLAALQEQPMPAALAAIAELAHAELALRQLRTRDAEAALSRARITAGHSGVPALLAETDEACRQLERIAARGLSAGSETPLRLADVEALFASGQLIIDACRRGVRVGAHWRSLARRPILFALLQALAQAWPGDAERHALIANVFRTRQPDETHRARLRVEMGRLRGLLDGMANIHATPRGFALTPANDSAVVILAPPIDGEQAALLALLADGSAWSSSALALALGASQRSIQRALVELEAAGQVRSLGRARAQRWLAPPRIGFTTILLLPATLSAE